jgi:hypothetical protein
MYYELYSIFFVMSETTEAEPQWMYNSCIVYMLNKSSLINESHNTGERIPRSTYTIRDGGLFNEIIEAERKEVKAVVKVLVR